MTKPPRALLVLFAAGASMVVTRAVVNRMMDARQRRDSFTGPVVVCKPAAPEFYPRCRFTMAGVHEVPTPDLDAITGATASVRLRSPSVYRDRRPSRLLRISYPTDRAVFPPNLCAPFVEWEDGENDLWQVRISIPALALEWQCITDRRRCRVPAAAWRTICRRGVTCSTVLQVRGVLRGQPDRPIHASEPVRLRVSSYPADGYIVYRLVVPPFSPRSTPDTFVRHIGSFEQRPFLRSRGQYCFNCHMFSSTDGRAGKLSIQGRFMADESRPFRVYVGVFDIDQQRGWKVKLPFDIQMTTFTAWSPDATKLAISANQQVGSIMPVVLETQNVIMPTSDIAVYDLACGRVMMLPGASDPVRLEAYPRWTPDGKAIVFAEGANSNLGIRARLSLRVVPYNDGRGGAAQDIPGASRNGKSHYFPRFSPDARWLSYCQCNAGSLIKSSSDLWIMPSHLNGPARRLECSVPYAGDSWHSWSSNSRWLVFASKRDDGEYARLYLAHIDAGGHASPAVRLPVEEPPMACYNIPEFVTAWPRLTERQLFAAIRVERPAIEVEEGQAP